MTGLPVAKRTLIAMIATLCAMQPALAQIAADAGLRVSVYIDERRNKIAIKNIDPEGGYRAYVYRQRNTADGTEIVPASDALLELWKGNATIMPDSDMLFESSEQFAPALLVVDVTNESGTPVQIANAYLRIEQSQTDRQPLIRMKADSCYDSQSRSINLQNDGWGTAEQATLTFAFGRDRPATESFVAALGNIGSVQYRPNRALTTLAPGLRALWDKPPKCARNRVPACLAELERKGRLGKLVGQLNTHTREFGDLEDLIFPEVTTTISGTLSYQWTHASGTVMQREQPLRQEIVVFSFDLGSVECGAAGPGESGFKAIKLATDRKAYRLPLPYRAKIGPRGNRRFELTLRADRASQHAFTVVLETTDGRVATSQPINLLYFTPKIEHGGVREVR